MKKIIGIILIVIVALNLISIGVHLFKDESVGSPLYIIILIILLILGGFLISKTNKGN